MKDRTENKTGITKGKYFTAFVFALLPVAILFSIGLNTYLMTKSSFFPDLDDLGVIGYFL